MRCTNGAHSNLVAASLELVKSLDPETSGRDRIAAVGRLKDAVAYLDPEKLFDEDGQAQPEQEPEDPTGAFADHVADALAGT